MADMSYLSERCSSFFEDRRGARSPLGHHTHVTSGRRHFPDGEKCFFFQPRVSYLGYVVELGRLSVAQNGTNALHTFDFHQTLTQIRSFAGD